MISRRELLSGAAVGVAGICAGCLGNDSTISASIFNDELVKDRLTGDGELSDSREQLLADIVAGGLTEGLTEETEHFTGPPMLYQDALYDVVYWQTDQRESYQFEAVPAADTIDGEQTPFDELPEADRRVLEPHRWRFGDESGSLDGLIAYEENRVSESELVGDQTQEVVLIGGASYRFEFTTTNPDSYIFVGQKVASSVSEYRHQLVDEHQFELSGLSEAERDIFEDAIDGGTSGDSDNDTLTSLVERFKEHETAIGDDWITRWKGTVYYVSIIYDAHW